MSRIGGVGVVAIDGAYDEIHATPRHGSEAFIDMITKRHHGVFKGVAQSHPHREDLLNFIIG